MRALVSFVCGGLLAAGFLAAGVTSPATILAGFVLHDGWDPRLWLMFLAAIAVQAPMRAAVAASGAAIDGTVVGPPSRRDVDARLVAGSLVFGVGWGLGGLCPGPGLAALGGGAAAWLFLAGLVAGVAAHATASRRAALPSPGCNRSCAVGVAPPDGAPDSA